MKIDKRSIILNSIIKEYLKKGLPISSNELKVKLNINMAASTIRVYFKKLSEEGSITQLHMSGGRIPTNKTLKEYWQRVLSPNKRIKFYDIDRIKKAIKEHGIYCMIKFYEKSFLKEIINVDERYLILVFDNGEIALKYNKKVEIFLKSFLEYELHEIYEISSQVGLKELANKLKSVLIDQNTIKEGEEFLLETSRKFSSSKLYEYYTNPLIFNKIENKIYFDNIIPEGMMAINQKAKIEDKDANMVCVGYLQNDFESFLEQISTKE